MNTFRPPRALALTLACLTTLVLVALASPIQAESRHGIRLRVPYSVELPDGTLVPPGTMTIWETRELSPVSAVHRVDAGGQVAMMAMSRRKVTELGAIAEPFVLFHRLPSGVLRLIGYAWSDGRNARAYLLVNDGPADRLLARRSIGAATNDDVMIVASLSGR